MPPLSILMKPASGNCNLRCKYCFYHSVTEIREVENYGMMKLGTLETIVQKALQFADGICMFAFQGGEPTLRGLDFYKKFIEFQKKYNTKNVRLNNAIQTNGIVIDDEWAEFLAENNFLVGISLDGPKDIHDSLRVDAKNRGSFNRVMNTISLFNKHRVEFNILCVVNSYVARHINKIYTFFKKNNFRYLQFIPCLDPLNEEPGGYDYSLTPERYAYFLKNLFDMWYDDIMKGNMVSIRYFDNLVGMLMGYPPEVCGMIGQCSCQFVIEADGGVYPCDFYVIDEWYLGNIENMGFVELKNSDAGKKFVEVSKHIDPRCTECKWFTLCRGGCRRAREPFAEGKPVLNYL
ncbi:MAG: anaerobic sulfatase maturase, partial [Thermoanaerobacteraceae bacterium]|nr:anaerobic sulfatase maturase [Thermoanaerobacteraceae bacterium]